MQDLPYAKKQLGQHWLYDEASLRAMCAAAEVQPGDTVFEIGPGTGSLTTMLLHDYEAKVIAVELDADRAADLRAAFSDQDFTLFEQSVLEFDLTSLPPDYKIVANIPYYLTSNLIRVLSEATNRPRIAALLVQKEVAERVAAGPGSTSLLTITAQFYWETRAADLVPARLFTPPPQVDSQILALTRRDAPLFPDVSPKDFFRVVKAGFSNRRKTLLNSLSGGLHLTRQQTTDMLTVAAVAPGRRPQELSMDDWYRLYLAAQNIT